MFTRAWSDLDAEPVTVDCSQSIEQLSGILGSRSSKCPFGLGQAAPEIYKQTIIISEQLWGDRREEFATKGSLSDPQSDFLFVQDPSRHGSHSQVHLQSEHLHKRIRIEICRLHHILDHALPIGCRTCRCLEEIGTRAICTRTFESPLKKPTQLIEQRRNEC